MNGIQHTIPGGLVQTIILVFFLQQLVARDSGVGYK